MSATSRNRLHDASALGVSAARPVLDSTAESLSETTSPLAHGLQRATDLGLIGVVFVAPLVMGGRHPIGQFAFVAFICLAATAWSLRQCLLRSAWRFSGAEWLLAAGLLVLVLQLAPLPAGLRSTLAPHLPDLLPLWTVEADASGAIGTWTTVTLTPAATRTGMVMYIAYAMLFLVVFQRAGGVEDVHRLLRWIGLAAVAMAALGLAQYLFGNGAFLWVYEHPSRTTFGAAKGTFINQNHFAHFLSLGIAPLLIAAHRLLERPSAASAFGSTFDGRTPHGEWRQLLLTTLLCGAGLVAVAALLSYSRGGALMILLALGVAASVLYFKGLLHRRMMLALACLGAIVAAAIGIHGHQRLAHRLQTITTAESAEAIDAGRVHLWSALTNAIPDFLRLGSGVGSHREVYPLYLDRHYDHEFTHAESGYLQLLLEGGAPGFVLLLIGLGLCLYWCGSGLLRSRSRRITLALAAAAPGLASSAIHSLFDFVWYIPACICLGIVLAACVCRLHRLATCDEPAEAPNPTASRTLQWAPLAVAATFALFGLSALFPSASAAPHWDRYLRQSLAIQQEEPDPQTAAEADARMMADLQAVLARDPGDPRANLRMAALLLREFDRRQQHAENVMALSQIRDAALASKFTSPAQLQQWLSAAVGENRQLLDQALHVTRRGLRGCPLQGEGYVYLAELAFLEGCGEAARRRHIEQAVRVRPHDGEVLFAAGRERLLRGEIAEAVATWKTAFHQSHRVRRQLVERLAPELPPLFFLDALEADERGMAMLMAHYRNAGRRAELEYVGRRFAAHLEAAAEQAPRELAVKNLAWAMDVHRETGHFEDAVRCGEQLIQLAPAELTLRKKLADSLMQAERFEEARQQYEWCLRHRPHDPAIQNALQDAQKLIISTNPPGQRTAGSQGSARR